MPLQLMEEAAPHTILGIWDIHEPEEWFLAQLSLSGAEHAEHQSIQAAGRRLEWLAARHMVKLLAWDQGLEYVFQKDGYGKPHLLNSGRHISISHSNGLCAAMIAPEPCGTDIQKIVEKIDRLAPRYLHPEENACVDASHRIRHLHVFWCAKEALYKAYGRRALDFREHIFIEPFRLNPYGGACTGWVRKDGFEAQYWLTYRFLDESYVWVYAGQRPATAAAF